MYWFFHKPIWRAQNWYLLLSIIIVNRTLYCRICHFVIHYIVTCCQQINNLFYGSELMYTLAEELLIRFYRKLFYLATTQVDPHTQCKTFHDYDLSNVFHARILRSSCHITDFFVEIIQHTAVNCSQNNIDWTY